MEDKEGAQQLPVCVCVCEREREIEMGKEVGMDERTA